jgi:hypothetical protein
VIEAELHLVVGLGSQHGSAQRGLGAGSARQVGGRHSALLSHQGGLAGLRMHFMLARAPVSPQVTGSYNAFYSMTGRADVQSSS